MAMRYLGRIVCAVLFLATALFPLTGSTILNGEDVRARLVLEAYRRAFPDRVKAIDYRDDDWTILIRDQRFYWAHGRLLPEKEKAKWASYRPYLFASYPDTIKDPSEYSAEKIARLRELGDAEVRMNGVDNHPAFRSALYGGATKSTAEDNLEPVYIFGRKLSVHWRMVEPVKRVDEAIAAAAKKDKATAAFLGRIGSLGCYNWREIRGTTRRSFHSWGLAVDIQPKSLGSKVTFWEWERDRNADWMLVPLAKRWAPPEAVIAAFEKEGFCWGGKWDFYDTMHFEYRPELHEMKKVLSAFGRHDAEKNDDASFFGIGGGEKLPSDR